MTEETTSATIQIGDLLVRSGIVAPELLDEVNRLAFKMRLPIGRILTMHGHVSEQIMSTAIEVQARIRDKNLPLDYAFKALNIAASEGISIDAALQKLTPKAAPKPVPTSNRLGEILMHAGYASPKQIEDGLIASAESGLPLGMVLLSKGIVSRSAINSALTAQKLIRNNVADRDKIVYALKNARLRAISLAQSLQENQIDPTYARGDFGVGELLVLSGAISESQLMTAKELEATEGKPLGTVMVENGFATTICIQAIVHLLKMINDGVLFEEQAAQIVKRIQFASSHDELNRALAEIKEQEEMQEEKPHLEVTDILKKSGLITDKELQIATALALANRQPLLKTLCDANLVDQKVLELATLCKTYLDHNLIQIEQATIAITYALDNNLTIDETLDCFGWSAPSD
jgi:hypothetical protein